MEELEIIQHYESLKRDYSIIKTILKPFVSSDYLLTDDVELIASFESQLDSLIDKALKYDMERLRKSQGGKRGASKLSKEERSERARKAGRARWHKSI